MDLWKELDGACTAASDIAQRVNALEIMMLGLAQARDPYADGFNALYNYLFDANQRLHQCLASCTEQI